MQNRHEDHQRSQRAYREYDAHLVYPLYVTKIEQKGRTIEELHQVISGMTT
ncbi:MAG: DUF2200 family protein [Leptolyngbyaceae cyanobacterium]